MPYEYVDAIESDVMFKVTAGSLEELLEDSAMALFNVMYDTKKVSGIKEVSIEIEAETLEALLYKFLAMLLVEGESNDLMFSSVHVKVNGLTAKAVLKGMPAKPELLETVVKAVTYHEYVVEKTVNGYYASVVVDV